VVVKRALSQAELAMEAKRKYKTRRVFVGGLPIDLPEGILQWIPLSHSLRDIEIERERAK
jgi:hypothetical protein